MKKITKVIIPAAGMGTRLLSATKEQPKEMLPVFSSNGNGFLQVKPILQIIFEQLFDKGFREFYFIVGRTKRPIEDHFTPDFEFIKKLKSKGKEKQVNDLFEFYNKVDQSSLVWINQAKPLGFGHAVLMAKNLIGNKSFLVHAGDTIIHSKNSSHIDRIIEGHISNGNTASILIHKVENPTQFGVIEGTKKDGRIIITDLEEKPAKPKTNLAIMPIYVFSPEIFDALKNVKASVGNEIQLTDGIKSLVKKGRKVIGYMTKPDDIWIDIGTPETFWNALQLSYQYTLRESNDRAHVNRDQ